MNEERDDLPTLGLSDVLAMTDEEDTELDKIAELFLDPKNLQHYTELSKSEVTAFSVLATLAKRHNLPVLQDFLLENLKLRVSKGRAGRKEWVKILSRHLEKADEEIDSQRVNRMFGRRRPPR